MDKIVRNYLDLLPTPEKDRWKKDIRNYTLKRERLHLKYLTGVTKCGVCGVEKPKDSILTTDELDGLYVCSHECGAVLIERYTNLLNRLKVEGFEPLTFELYQKQNGVKNPIDTLNVLARK